MNIHIGRTGSVLLLAASAIGLAGCGSLSQGIAPSGDSATTMVWPAVTDATPMHKGGTFPNRDNVASIHAGLNKQQVADLVGEPHFSEGVWNVQEWNYVFNFRDPSAGDKVTVCQFKILFDQDKIARSFYWQPSECAPYQMPMQ